MDIRRFDIHRLVLKPLTERIHDLHVDCVRPLAVPLTTADPALGAVADRIVRARGSGASVIMFMGGHVVRSGGAALHHRPHGAGVHHVPGHERRGDDP